jgi:LuxR family maltose regulon positive regulatory protein
MAAPIAPAGHFLYNVCMSGDLLQTKLYIPPLRPNIIPRPRLIHLLNQGLQLGRKLTLLSAPAGSGKTTLLTEWLSSVSDDFSISWLSLDTADTELVLGAQT